MFYGLHESNQTKNALCVRGGGGAGQGGTCKKFVLCNFGDLNSGYVLLLDCWRL